MDSSLGAWDIAGHLAKNIGVKLVDGYIESQLGIGNIQLTDTVLSTGTALAPMISDSYAAQPGDPWYETWGRRVKLTAGIGVGIGVTAGLVWLVYKMANASKTKSES